MDASNYLATKQFAWLIAIASHVTAAGMPNVLPLAFSLLGYRPVGPCLAYRSVWITIAQQGQASIVFRTALDRVSEWVEALLAGVDIFSPGYFCSKLPGMLHQALQARFAEKQSTSYLLKCVPELGGQLRST
jgi:hypothetical protein